MNEIKTIFFDLDNTLYDHLNQVIPTKHIEALRQLKEKGYKVCVCTGRPMILVEELNVLDLIEWDAFVCGNGCYVYDKNLNPLYECPIDSKSADIIFDYAQRNDLGVLGFGNVKMATRLDQKVQEMIDTFHYKDIDFRERKESDIFTNLLFKPEDTMKHIEELDELEDLTTIYMKQWVEFKRSDTSKYEGIERVMNHFDEPVHQYLAFGDSAIDYEMLENAAIKVMVANGDARLKTIEDIQIAPSCTSGGVYTWLKENHWID